jgi:hypothetical protein
VVLILMAATGIAARYSLPNPMRLEVGAFTGGYLTGPWSGVQRADVDPQATEDGQTTFYYRAARPRSHFYLPVEPGQADLRVTLRARAPVRSSLALFAGGRPAGDVLVDPGAWRQWSIAIPPHLVQGSGADIALDFRPLPLVAGDHAARPELLVDYIEAGASGGHVLNAASCMLLAVVPLAVFVFALAIGTRGDAAVAASAVSAVAVAALARLATVSLLLATPRLLPVALVAGFVTQRLLRRSAASLLEGTILGWVMAAGVLFYGSLSFFPNHNPPGLDPHVRRTLDLGSLPFEYQAILQYGSQLTAVGEASATFGQGTLIPYSPMPFIAYYAVHLLGVDLYWGITMVNVVLAMAVAPWLWVVAGALWSRRAAWLSLVLYVLDLAVWFRVGRVHAPGAFGGALATAALLYLALEAGRLDTTRRVIVAGLFLGSAVLGYSSLVVLVGLFGATLVIFLLVDAREWTAAARRGTLATLVVGAALAGGLYYFHYVPGILKGSGALEGGIDPFPGRTFFVFHNESRQSMWIWMLGFRFVVPAGLLAAPLALRSLRRPAGPVMASWLLAWALVMLLKEPLLFPKLLRWAKEDQFVSPLLCLFMGAAVWSLPHAWMRWTAAVAMVAAALWLQLRCFAYLANSLLV